MLLFLSILFCLSISSAKGGCPQHWVDATDYDLGCLLLFNWNLNHQQHTWPASNEFCNSLGNNTRLVEIYTPDQKDALTDILIEHNGLYYWVGATDARHEGTWTWGSGASVDDFVWMINQATQFLRIVCSGDGKAMELA